MDTANVNSKKEDKSNVAKEKGAEAKKDVAPSNTKPEKSDNKGKDEQPKVEKAEAVDEEVSTITVVEAEEFVGKLSERYLKGDNGILKADPDNIVVDFDVDIKSKDNRQNAWKLLVQNLDSMIVEVTIEARAIELFVVFMKAHLNDFKEKNLQLVKCVLTILASICASPHLSKKSYSCFHHFLVEKMSETNTHKAARELIVQSANVVAPR